MLAWSRAGAQQEVEYKMEVGGALGTSFYLGDVNSTPFAQLCGMGTLLMRRNFNPRMAIKANLGVAHLRGSSDDLFLPDDPLKPSAAGGTPVSVSFGRNVIDMGAQFEMNFWGYGYGGGYKDLKRITPYALAGMGFTLAPGGDRNGLRAVSSCGCRCEIQGEATAQHRPGMEHAVHHQRRAGRRRQ